MSLTLVWPVAGREAPDITVPLVSFCGGNESWPFTNSGGGGGTWVRNWENFWLVSLSVNNGTTPVITCLCNLQEYQWLSPLCGYSYCSKIRLQPTSCEGDMSFFCVSMSEGDIWESGPSGESWLASVSGENASLLSSSNEDSPAPFGESERDIY